MRKEPIVFVAVAALLGWLFSDMLSNSAGNARPPRPRAKDYVGANMPDIDLALADTSRPLEVGRDLFSPPSPTQPLPPLPIELPPLEPLGALAAPSSWGPAPRHFGGTMRRPDRPSNARDIPGLFDVEESFGEGDEATEAVVADALAELDDPDARAARIAALKKQYDWIYLSSYKFGRIQNQDRYRPEFLSAGASGADIVFLEVDPTTGVPKFAGQTVTYPRANIPEAGEDFGLVDNVVTEIEVGHASFPEPIPSSRFDGALAFSERCLLLRNETPRALEVAEDLCRRAQAINAQDDPRPRLGLARCYELGFRLEDAYEAYEDLLRSGHDTDAVVHARLADLTAQLRMDDVAEARFEDALRVERSNWEARWRYGRFLAQRGRIDEALPHLREATQREPRGPEDRAWRVQVRLEYAGALLQSGQADEALNAFQSAVSADVANEVGMVDVALAGLMSAARFATGPAASALLNGAEGVPAGGAAAGAQAGGGSFELLLATGLVAMDTGRFKDSATLLGLARQADPFRAHEALRGLSRLAEITGNPEDAIAFADEALAANPLDPWTLYHRGRLAEQAGDAAEAQAAYRAALDLELDLVPALERLAALVAGEGDHGSAERYYARAVQLAPGDARLHSRRGWNALQLDDIVLAEASLREARRIDPGIASARSGLAWWRYATGDATEAVILFGEIVDDRRSAGEEDAVMAHAEAQVDRIRDHATKEVFTDRFDRPNGRVGNDWKLDQGFGPLADLVDGQLVIDGTQDRDGRTRVFRALPPDRFLAFSVELTIGRKAKGTRAGVFISSERTRAGGEAETMTEIVLSRSNDGELQVRVLKDPNDTESTHVNVLGPSWRVGETVRVTIERTGEDLDSRFTLYLNGEPVAPDLEADRLMASRQPVNFGAFVEGQPGRVADLVVDNVRVVRRK